MLTEKQKEVYISFIEAINNRDFKLLSSEDRAWGKSYIINELGFELQALEYRVFLLTEFTNNQEHFATDVLRDDYNLRGIDKLRSIVLVDEYRFSRMKQILEICSCYRIPIVGFVDYKW